MDPGSFSVEVVLLAATTTWQPARARPRASARPIPRLAPVTMATLPGSVSTFVLRIGVRGGCPYAAGVYQPAPPAEVSFPVPFRPCAPHHREEAWRCSGGLYHKRGALVVSFWGRTTGGGPAGRRGIFSNADPFPLLLLR